MSNVQYSKILSELDHWGSYETSAKPRDISKLGGIRQLLDDLKQPEQDFKIVHVAGTNGKGLTATMISRLLMTQGFSTGCYTSPHLVDIRERVTLDGNMISREAFAQSASKVLQVARSYQGEPYLSYFDVLTAIAFVSFKKHGAQWVVLETGLGGQADSTNITPKELSVLTRIGLDHQDVLGSEIRGIAQEKMGITRAGIPTVISRQTEELQDWLPQQLAQKEVPCFFSHHLFQEHFSDLPNFSAEMDDFEKNHSEPWKECARTSLSAMQLLFSKENASEQEKQKISWLKNLFQVKMQGRLDFRQNMIWKKEGKRFEKIILDGGHNEDALEALNDFICKKEMDSFALILGMASDKIQKSIQLPLKKLCDGAAEIYLTPIQSPRTATPQQMFDFLNLETQEAQQEIRLLESADQALRKALKNGNQALVVAGSFYLVGEVFGILEGEEKNS